METAKTSVFAISRENFLPFRGGKRQRKQKFFLPGQKKKDKISFRPLSRDERRFWNSDIRIKRETVLPKEMIRTRFFGERDEMIRTRFFGERL